MKIFMLVLAGSLLFGLVVASAIVEWESAYVRTDLGGPGPGRALVLFHPSRDQHFSDAIANAFAAGLQHAGYHVELATLTRETPAASDDYTLVAVVSNTFFFTPDRPTLRYLERAKLTGTPVVGLICGAGSTERAERVLARALQQTGATVLATRHFWLWRPNDEHQMEVPNRQVAIDLAEAFGRAIGAKDAGSITDR